MLWPSFVRLHVTRRCPVRNSAFLVPGVMFALSLAGCSGDSLSSDLREVTTDAVQDRLEQVDVLVSEGVADCAARKLTDAQAAELSAAELSADAISSAMAQDLADNVVACAGVVTIARSSLAPLAPSASEASLDCAAEQLDSELVRKALAADLQGQRLEGALVDLDVVTALGVCLTPAELLDAANG